MCSHNDWWEFASYFCVQASETDILLMVEVFHSIIMLALSSFGLHDFPLTLTTSAFFARLMLFCGFYSRTKDLMLNTS